MADIYALQPRGDCSEQGFAVGFLGCFIEQLDSLVVMRLRQQILPGVQEPLVRFQQVVW